MTDPTPIEGVTPSPETPPVDPTPVDPAPTPVDPVPQSLAPAAPVPPTGVPPTQAPTVPPVETPPAQTPAEPPKPVTERVVPAADGYKLPDGVPKEVGQFANKHDMTQEQLNATLKQFGSIVQNTKKSEMATMRAAGEAHVKNWGDQGQHNLTLAKRALAQNDPTGELKQALDTSGFGNHPAVLNFLHNLGKSMQEGGYLKSAINRPPGKKTAAQSMYGENHPSVE